MADIVQTSLDGGVSWTDHKCSKASACWQRVGRGSAVTMVSVWDMQPEPDEDTKGSTLVRIKRSDGSLQPLRPLRATVQHLTINGDIPTVQFDGRRVRQR